ADPGIAGLSAHFMTQHILVLRAKKPIELESGLRITAWPITLLRGRKLKCCPLLSGREITFGPMDLSSITRFIAFEVTLVGDRLKVPPQTFVLRVPADRLPTQLRDEAVVRQVVRNRDGFLRYLLFLLGDFDAFADGEGSGAWSPGTGDQSRLGTLPLLEQMTRAFCREPSRLDAVRRLVEHLRTASANGEDGEIVPDDFVELWEVFESALPGGDRDKPAP
ncbi:MAG: hypothetical protein OXN89_15175, partial [Bryobacterales bacterium]|nr:hypothetical protein [Bryobacterales bacterium]